MPPNARRTTAQEDVPSAEASPPDAAARPAHGGSAATPAAPDWMVLDANGEAPRLSTGNLWEPLVDNERAFDALLDAIAHAEHSILLTQLLFEPDIHGAYPTGEMPDPARARRRGHGRLADALREATARQVQLRIVLNENAAIPDHVDELRGFLDDCDHVAVRAARRNPGVMHVKLLLVDDKEAYVVGSPFQQKYWDTRRHLANEPRRGPDNHPLHEVSLRLRGPVVRDLRQEFVRIWRMSLGDPEPRPVVETLHPSEGTAHAMGSASAGPHTLQVTLTTPSVGRAGVLERRVDGQDVPPQSLVTLGARVADRLAMLARPRTSTSDPDFRQARQQSIMDAYARALRNARQFLYAENQYFTNAHLARLIDDALCAQPQLQVILVLNEHMDIPGYDSAQVDLLGPLLARHGDRLGLFSAWTPRAARTPEGKPALRHIYVHSKTTIVDDAWATIGSANWDGASLDGAAELGIPEVVNEELNVMLYDGIDGAPRTGEAARLRVDLWSELLDVPTQRLLAAPPPGGWLALWREVAAANQRQVRAGKAEIQGLILPYAADFRDSGVMPSG